MAGTPALRSTAKRFSPILQQTNLRPIQLTRRPLQVLPEKLSLLAVCILIFSEQMALAHDRSC